MSDIETGDEHYNKSETKSIEIYMPGEKESKPINLKKLTTTIEGQIKNNILSDIQKVNAILKLRYVTFDTNRPEEIIDDGMLGSKIFTENDIGSMLGVLLEMLLKRLAHNRGKDLLYLPKNRKKKKYKSMGMLNKELTYLYGKDIAKLITKCSKIRNASTHWGKVSEEKINQMAMDIGNIISKEIQEKMIRKEIVQEFPEASEDYGVELILK